MKLKDIKIKPVHKVLFVISAVFITAAAYFGQYLGFNTTPSVPFNVYYHTSLENYKIKTGDFILFSLPENQLYIAGENAVKQVACSEGQYLKSVKQDKKVHIDFFCDGRLITTTKIFTRPNYEPLDFFTYNGVIPKGNYFVTGDHYQSYDSRYWGFVTEKNIKRLVHPIAFSNPFISSAYAKGFYEDRERGWYKYEAIPKEDKEEEKEDEIKKLEKPIIPWDRVAFMPVKEFSKLFEDVQDYAMTYRTLENFDMYAKLRKVMFDRSLEFMNVSILWGQLHPEDSSEGWFPTSGFGQNTYTIEADKIRLKYIRENRSEFGLLYFYKNDCAFCEKQTPLIKYIQDETSWAIKFIDADKTPEALLRFNINTVPALILAERKTSRWFPLSAGIITAEQIYERLYRTIKYLKGETDETNFSDLIKPDTFIGNK